MCGISGIFNLNKESVSPVILKRMTDTISHRGPDGDGMFIKGSIGLGHRRLSIIDLSPLGHQPMISNDQNLILTYNGEIYNFQELRIELESLGHTFRSKTDSEVVLNSWKEWGESCVLKFNGMFAFAIWDRNLQSLFLVRDRYGIKPLYYAQFGNAFLFSSEQKSIMEHPKFKKEVAYEALFEYFTFQNLFTNKTLFKNVNLLEPASIACINGQKGLQIKKYWDYQFEDPDEKYSQSEYEEELNRLIKQAVNRQLVTDVELGSYLSGGMDSGTLTALSAKQIPDMKTFTCGFDLSSASGMELLFDERQKAEAMSAVFKTEHYEMVLKAGDMERCMKKLAYHLEEPRIGQCYPNFYAAQLASKFVKVVLSGAGGDELFGGYPWRYYRAASQNNFADYINEYYSFWQRLIDGKNMKSVFQPIWNKVNHISTKEIFMNVFSNHKNKLEKPEDYINHSLYFEAKTFLHGLFIVEDKISMAHSLETRVPFMDNDLVDFAMRCPVSLKINNLQNVLKINENTMGNKQQSYFKKTNDGKQILRNVMRDFVPDNILKAQKQGFSSPDASWFKGESIKFVKRTLFNKNATIYNFMDEKSIQTLIQEHLDGKKNRRLLIWSLLNFEEFSKNNFY